MAFIHDFSNYAAAAEADRRAVETLRMALAGAGRPFVITSGTLLLRRKGSLAAEEDEADPNFPRKSETAGLAMASQGVRVSVVRLPPSVHGDGDHGFVPTLINIAREKGVSAYIGEGRNRWTAVHRLDTGNLYRLALEKGSAGARYHGVAQEGIAFRDIAEAIGKGLKIPVVSLTAEEATNHFGWFAAFAGIDCPASSKLTQERLGWHPVQTSLLGDLERGSYFKLTRETVGA